MRHETEYEKMQRVPAPLITVHERLINWALWSRDRKPQGHCRSIEYRYKSPNIWGHDEPEVKADPRDALALYQHVTQLPYKSRWILHLWYVHRAPAHYIRRKLGLNSDQLINELNHARSRLNDAKNALN